VPSALALTALAGVIVANQATPNISGSVNPPGWGDDWPTPTWPDGEGPKWLDRDDLIPTVGVVPMSCGPEPDEDCEEARKLGMAICAKQGMGARGMCQALVLAVWAACLYKESGVDF
jgi:hypothetical protein